MLRIPQWDMFTGEYALMEGVSPLTESGHSTNYTINVRFYNFADHVCNAL